MEIHEHPILEGAIGSLESRLEHHDFRGLHHYIAKHNEYSTWEAARFEWLRRSGPEEWSKLTRRQRFKYSNLDRWWLSYVYFAASYFLKRGFLDGWTGLVFNQLKWRYFQDIRLKILELSQRNSLEKSSKVSQSKPG